jgi:hypothetical protein
MEPVTGALIGSAVLGAGASILGSSKASKQAKEALAEQKRQFDAIAARLDAIGIPPEAAMRIVLEDPRLMGQLDPQLEQQIRELQSGMADVQADPRLQEMQLEALSGIQERASGGLTPEDMIAIKSIRENSAGQLASQDANIIQNMEQRGMGGSGLELAMRQTGGQNAMRQASDEADRLAAMQYQAKMAAMDQLGSMSTQMRTQDFGEQAQKAGAMDAMSQFNLANQIGSSQRNVDREIQRATQNLAMKQASEEARAANRRAEEMQRVNAKQQNYMNEMQKANTLAGVQTNMANAAGQAGATQAANTMNMYGGIADAISSAGSAYAQYNKKEK